MSALASRERSPWWRGDRLARVLFIIFCLAYLAALIAIHLPGSRPPSPHSLLGVASRIDTGLFMFVLGGAFLLYPAADPNAAPETLSIFQDPIRRRRFAYFFFAVGVLAVLIDLFH
jgi:hypothetical protein